ncbi:hypothetical protein CLU79DRAFT_744373 [Phycomyces nitens]|nr:hypothetical protein CLU79DRAFT_744373 [Phycomyces nitens]
MAGITDAGLRDAYKTVERSLILNKQLDQTVASQIPAATRQSFEDIMAGRYASVVENSPVFKDAHQDRASLLETGNVEEWIAKRLDNLPKDDETSMQVLATGIACLNAFVQINWTGPIFNLAFESLFSAGDKQIEETLKTKIQTSCLSSLSADSEEVYHLTEQLGWLAAARQILMNDNVRHSRHTAAFWAQRAVFIQQQLLDEGAGSIQSLIILLSAESAAALGINHEELDEETLALKVRHSLEMGLVLSFYGQDKEAFEKMTESQKASGFEWSLTGALGRRTKFQTFDVSQLVVHAESKKEDVKVKVDEEAPRPETLELDDDTLLDDVSYAKTEDNDKDESKRHGNLNIIDQCLLLAFCLNVKNTNPDHGITTEEMNPYVVRVLGNVNNWMVHTMALLLRTRLEAHRTRTVERSALQLQALVDQIKVDDSGPEERLAYFYDLLLPSKWEMERELAGRFVSLGVVRSALEIFERLEMWEDVIGCYQMLEQPLKAKQVIERLMVENPNSAKLWCILGDVEVNPEHWKKAWELSNHTFARAMRSLGSYHYKHENFPESIECYKKALAINPLFEGSWYILGCAGMQAEQWDVAMRAFQRVVSIDQEQAEAWNNLSSIYIRLGRKPDAFLALKQATRIKFDSWKIWQNLLYVSVDIGQFSDAIWAMQRIVDMRWDKEREDCVDVPVLRLIVESVIQNWKDAHNRDGARLAKQVQRLLEDVILTRITSSPDIWSVCAKFYLWQNRYTDALEASLKAYRAVMHDVRIETDASVFEEVANLALDTVDMYETLGEKKENDAVVCADWKYQARSIIKSLMGKARDNFEDTATYERLKERLEDLKRS